MSALFSDVIIVGAGPTGLTLALLLAKRDVKVVVLEALEQVDQRPRGIAYGSPAVRYVGIVSTLFCVLTDMSQSVGESWRPRGSTVPDL